jgi:hypothetical protein
MAGNNSTSCLWTHTDDAPEASRKEGLGCWCTGTECQMEYSSTNHDKSGREIESGTGSEDATDREDGTGRDETQGDEATKAQQQKRQRKPTS